MPVEPGVNPLVRYMSRLPRANPPGAKFNYNTGETDLVGILVRVLQRLGSGHYNVGTVHGQELLTVDSLDAAVLAALFHRERTGEGQYIDMALLDVQVAMIDRKSTRLNSSH